LEIAIFENKLLSQNQNTEVEVALLNRLWQTKGCRFVARERLRATNLFSIVSVTALSIYVITSSLVLVGFAGELQGLNEKWLNIVNVALSVLIVAFSLIEFARDHTGNSEALNTSALQIGELYGTLEAKSRGGVLQVDDIVAAEIKYATILRECKINHTNLDYLYFRNQHPKEFRAWYSVLWPTRFFVFVLIFLARYWIYIAAVFGFPLLALMYGENVLTLR
jgi:hypothetical protein